MKILGALVFVFGALVVLSGFTMDPTISSGTGRTVNLQLLSEKTNIILIGMGMFLGGAILFSASAVIETLKPLARTDDHPDPALPPKVR